MSRQDVFRMFAIILLRIMRNGTLHLEEGYPNSCENLNIGVQKPNVKAQRTISNDADIINMRMASTHREYSNFRIINAKMRKFIK